MGSTDYPKWLLSGTYRHSPKHSSKITEYVTRTSEPSQTRSSLLEKGAIEPVPLQYPGASIYSLHFLIPKKDGSLRPILDFRDLNLYIQSDHFHMVILQQVLPRLQQGDFLSTLDLKDAYFHIPTHPAHRKYLRFVVARQHYQFKVPPFGFTTAPRVFTKCLVVVAAHLRRQHIHVFPYLDDWHIKASSQAKCLQHTHKTVPLLHDLGFTVNLSKSHLQPSHTQKYLGATLDTQKALACPSPARIRNIQVVMSQFQPSHSLPARVFMQLVGMMASCILIVPYARLQMRPLQECVARQWIQSQGLFSDLVLVDGRTHRSLLWWNPQNLSKGRPFIYPVPQTVLTANASLTDWGAHPQTHTFRACGVSSKISFT